MCYSDDGTFTSGHADIMETVTINVAGVYDTCTTADCLAGTAYYCHALQGVATTAGSCALRHTWGMCGEPALGKPISGDGANGGVSHWCLNESCKSWVMSMRLPANVSPDSAKFRASGAECGPSSAKCGSISTDSGLISTKFSGNPRTCGRS